MSSCFAGSENHNHIKKETKLQDTIQLQESEYAQKLNLGFEDSPAFIWAEIIGNLNLDENTYHNILEIKYTFFDTGKSDTVYYETFGRENLIFKQSNSKISLYPGDVKIDY